MQSTAKSARCLICLVYLSAMTACTLLRTPVAPVRLQLTLEAERIDWPAELSLGDLHTSVALKSDRIIVVRGAVVMQHAGIRWVSTLDQLLNEQLNMLHVGRGSQNSRSTRSQQRFASIDLWVSEFNVLLSADAASSATVAFSAALTCPDASIHALTRSRVTLPLNSSDPQRVAAQFNQAATDALIALLRSAEHRCPPRPVSQSRP